MNHSWGGNHKTTSHRSSHTNVHGIYSSISNKIASRIERKRGRAMVKANCSNYLCWKSKRAFLSAGSKQHGSKSWGRECSPTPAPPLLPPTGPYLAAFGSSFSCCFWVIISLLLLLTLEQSLAVWFYKRKSWFWKCAALQGQSSGVVCLCRGTQLNQHWFSMGLFGRSSLENDYPKKRLAGEENTVL